MIKYIVIVACVIRFELLSSEDIKKCMRMMTSAVGRTVLECQEEVEFSDHVIKEFRKFWDPRHPVQELEVGCATFCVLLKLQLIEPNGTMRTDNIKAFGRANGAGEGITSTLVSTYDECKLSTSFEEPCSAGMGVATCFREKVFQMQWAPSAYVQYDDDEF